MKPTIRVIARAADSGVVEVKCLIRHPMDSGFVKDKAGHIIPPHYIQTVTFNCAGKPVFVADWGPAVSKDPYLEFFLPEGKSGDVLEIHWIDNKGEHDSLRTTIS